jgi:hypothetical protein
MLGLIGGKRTMYLGAPLVMGLRRQHLRSILAHELGHYSGRHTALGGVTYRGRETIERVVERFGHKSMVGKVFSAYSRLYVVLTFAVSRQQELEADDFSAEVAGRDAAAAALAELPVINAAWEHYFEEFVTPVHDAGKRPLDFFEGFSEVLAAPRLQVALASFRTEFDEREKSRYDTHPPRSARIQRFASMPEDGVSADPTPALDLFDDVGTMMRELQEWMYRETRLEAAPWTDLLHGHEPQEVRERAEMLYRAAKAAEPGEISLGTIVGSLRGRQLTTWIRPHLEDPSSESIQEASDELVRCVVDEALMAVAGARVELAWDEDARLVDQAGQVLESRPVVEQAIRSSNPGVLAEWLADHGVGLDYVPHFPELDPRREVETQAPRVLEALAPIAGDRKLFCLVLNHGVLLRKARGGDQVAWWLGGKDPGRHLLARVLGRSGQQLIEEGGNTWLPWETIVSVRVGRGRTRRPKLTFHCTDGSTHAVKYRMHTTDSGETIPALRYFLEDRFLA